MSSAAAHPGQSFSHRETVVIIVGLMLGMFLAALDQTIIATALPRMAGDLNGAEHLSWVVSSYLLTSTAVTPIYGKLSDLYGRKPLLQVAIIVFVITSLLCGLAQTMPQLILFRALQGMGGGGLLAMAHATIADILSPRERGRYQAYFASVFAAASVLGPVLGGLFADHLSWRWVFWINLPVGLGALVMAEVTLKRLVAKRLRHKIDYAGAILIVAAVCCVLVVTTMGGNELPWASPMLAAIAGAGVVLFGLVVWQECTAPEPILPPRLFAERTFLGTNLISLFTAMGMVGGLIFMPLYLQLVFGLNADDSGLMLIPLSAATVAGAISSGQMVSRTGHYKLFPMLGTVLTAAACLYLATLGPDASLIRLGVVMAATGLGIGWVLPSMLVAIQNATDVRDLGTATASINFFRSMGGSFGVALYGAVLLGGLNTGLADVPGLGENPALALLHRGPTALSAVPAEVRASVLAALVSAFHAVFAVAAGLAAIAFALVLWLREQPLRATSGIEERALQGMGD